MIFRPLLTSSLTLLAATAIQTHAETIVAMGPGSYTLERPESCDPLPTEIYQIESLKGAIPTNQWWSSLVWKPFSQALFAHPLTLRCEENGLVLSDPSGAISGAGGHIMGGGIPVGRRPHHWHGGPDLF